MKDLHEIIGWYADAGQATARPAHYQPPGFYRLDARSGPSLLLREKTLSATEQPIRPRAGPA